MLPEPVLPYGFVLVYAAFGVSGFILGWVAQRGNYCFVNAMSSVFTTRTPPWHGLGTIFAENPTVAQALEAMNASGWLAIKVPAEYNGVVVPGAFWNVRSDTNTVLGSRTLGKKYHVIQYETGMSILEEIAGEIILETGGLLGNNGERAFICCKLPTTTKIAGDIIEHYFVILMSHDGSSSLVLMITPIRVVCQNTANLALAKAKRTYNIIHTLNYDKRVKEAAKVLGIVQNYYTTFPAIVNQLVALKRTERQFSNLVDKVFHKPDEDANKQAWTAFEKARELCFTALHLPNLANIKDRAWGHYNAIVDVADHARQSRGDDEAVKAANRFMRTFTETTLKDEAAKILLAVR